MYVQVRSMRLGGQCLQLLICTSYLQSTTLSLSMASSSPLHHVQTLLRSYDEQPRFDGKPNLRQAEAEIDCVRKLCRISFISFRSFHQSDLNERPGGDPQTEREYNRRSGPCRTQTPHKLQLFKSFPSPSSSSSSSYTLTSYTSMHSYILGV